MHRHVGIKRMAWPLAALLLWAAAAGAAASTPPAWGLITVCDGPVEVIRGTERLQAREGLALQAQDIVRTSADTRLARIETPQGAALDLGPQSQLLLQAPREAASAAHLAAHLAEGWAKLSSNGTAAPTLAGGALQAAPQGKSVLVMHVQAAPKDTLLFVESGQGRVFEPANAAPAELNEGQAFRKAGAADSAPGVMLVRAPADFVSRVPQALRDTLPRRANRFAGRTPVEPQALGRVQADDIAVWTQVSEPLRAQLAQRFALRTELAKAAPRKPVAKSGSAVTARARNTSTVAARRKAEPASDKLQPQIDTLPQAALMHVATDTAARAALPETNTRLPDAPLMSAPLPVLAAAEAPATTAPVAAPVVTAAPIPSLPSSPAPRTLARGR